MKKLINSFTVGKETWTLRVVINKNSELFSLKATFHGFRNQNWLIILLISECPSHAKSTCIKYLGMQIIQKKISGECENVIRINFHNRKILLILSKRYSSGATQTVPNSDFFKVAFQLSFSFLYRYTDTHHNIDSFKV